MDASTPLVFLHAFPLNASIWESQVAAFPRRATLAPNFPGFGGRAVGDATLDAFALAVLADMDSAGIDRAVVIGLSMGGYTALRLHALAPERVAALVLADTRGGSDDEAGRLKRADQAARARREGVGWMADALIPALLGEQTRKTRPAVVQAVRELIGGGDAEGVARALEAMAARPDSTPHLARIAVPTLVLVGDEDTLTPPPESQKIADAVPGARLTRIPGAGHLSNLEAPEGFNQALRDFVG